MYAIRFFNEIVAREEVLSRATHKICRNIIQGLDEVTLIDLRCQANLDWYLCEQVHLRLEQYSSPISSPPLRYNKSWRGYLKDIQQRKLGQVSWARKQLQEMFPFLEWKAQCEVLSYFLTGTAKRSRVWALKTLTANWSLLVGRGLRLQDKWLTIVLDLWDKYQEKEAALCIVSHACEDCVLKMEQELSKSIGYQRVALRLGANPNYEVNHSALPHLSWLYVMAKLKRRVETAVCRTILFEVLMEAWTNEQCPPMLGKHGFSFALDSQVGLALWCLGELKQPDLIMSFFISDIKLQDHLLQSLKGELSPAEYWGVMCKEAPKYFPLSSSWRGQEQMDAFYDRSTISQSLIK